MSLLELLLGCTYRCKLCIADSLGGDERDIRSREEDD